MAVPFQKPEPRPKPKFHTKVFLPHRDKDSAAISEIREKTYRGLAEVLSEDRQFDPRTGIYRIYMEWAEFEFITDDDIDKLEDESPFSLQHDAHEKEILEGEEAIEE